FCRRPWSEERPMVEGHRGSLICAACLTVAYTDVVLAGSRARPPEGQACTMCLEKGDQPHWISPAFPEAAICTRCIRQSSTVLEKDKEFGWKRPGAANPPG